MTTIVMTGATGGLGAKAAAHFTADPGIRLIVGARGAGRTVPGAQVLPLDLVSLASVRDFAAGVQERLGEDKIDALVLNAGLNTSDLQQRTVDGFEVAFAANHLAHYLLARLLLNNVADNGRLVITTSDTHDPGEFPLAPRSMDPQALADPYPGGRLDAFRAYPSSKLANLLTARSFAARDDITGRAIEVIAYNPGFTMDTGLAGSAVWSAVAAKVVLPVLQQVSRLRPGFTPGTSDRAGEALAQLTLGTVKPPPGRIYASVVNAEITYPDPAKLARNDIVRDRLWRESAEMVGLPA